MAQRGADLGRRTPLVGAPWIFPHGAVSFRKHPGTAGPLECGPKRQATGVSIHERSQIGVLTHLRTLEPVMIADLDTLLTALYVELTDRIIPLRGPGRRGPGRPPEVTDAELACLAVAQVLLRCDDERHWLRAAPGLIGHLFPRLLAQGEYNARLR